MSGISYRLDLVDLPRGRGLLIRSSHYMFIVLHFLLSLVILVFLSQLCIETPLSHPCETSKG